MALHHRLPQLVILGVSIDEDPQAYRNFLVENHIDFLTIRDPSQAVMHRYGTDPDSGELCHQPLRPYRPQICQRSRLDEPRNHPDSVFHAECEPVVVA